MNTHRVIVTLILLFIHGSVLALSQQRKEAVFMVLRSPGMDYAHSVAYGDNGFYVTGYSNGNLAFNITTSMVNAGNDAFLVKYSNKGELLWGVGLSSPGLNYAYSVTASADSVYAAGYTTGNLLGQTNAGIQDAFVVKYSSQGEFQWSKLIGTPNTDFGYGVRVSSDGVYVVGVAGGKLTVDGVQTTHIGSTDAFIFKLSLTTGAAIWGHCFGSVKADQANGVGVGSDGSVVVTGQYYDPISVGGQTITNSGLDDMFVIKYNTNGVFQWLKGVGSSASDYGNAVAIDSENNIYAVGYSAGTINTLPEVGQGDSIIIKYSSDGTVLWTRRLNCDQKDQAFAVTVTSSGVVMAGSFVGTLTFAQTTVTSAGSQDAYVVEYSKDGDELWVVSGGGQGIDFAYGAAANGDDVFVAGRANGGKWGNFVGDKSGASDAFVARYSRDLVDCNSDLFKDSPECTSVAVCAQNAQCSCIEGYSGSYCSLGRKCNSTLFDKPTVCSSHGTCVGVDNCMCYSGYTNDFCDIAVCYDISAEKETVCSGHGSCVGPNDCSCSRSYHGSECEKVYTCNGIRANESAVCSKHGECIGMDTCQCETGWAKQYCEAPVCFNVNSTDTQNVCSGHGQCVNVDQCKCSGGWEGEKCDVPLCFGMGENDANVCSGRGRCIGGDNCVCNQPYAGYKCQRKCEHCYVNY